MEEAKQERANEHLPHWRDMMVPLAMGVEKIGLPGYASSLAGARNPADASRALYEATIVVATANGLAKAWGNGPMEALSWEVLGLIGKARAPIEAAMYGARAVRNAERGGGGR